MSRRTWAAAAAVLPIVLLTGCDQPQPWRSELVSLNADGTGSGNDYSHNPVFSPDGTMIAFESRAWDLGPTEGNGALDVFLRDLATGTTTLVSVNAAGTQSGNQGSVDPVFSPDGRKIAFVSSASDLVPSDGNGVGDVFVRDLDAGTTTLVSATSTDVAGNGESTAPAFSLDGTRIAFESDASDLAGPDTNLLTDVFVRDLAAGTTTLVSRNAAGTDAGAGPSSDPQFASAGRVVFESRAGDLGPTDANGGLADLYLRDLTAGTTSLVSANAGGTNSGNRESLEAVVSPDGTKATFRSWATDLGPTDSNSHADIYLRDLVTGTTSLVTINAAGTDAGNEPSFASVFSPDSTKIAFVTEANDLGPPDSGTGAWIRDIYLRDLTTGTTSLVSVNLAGTGAGNIWSNEPIFSPDGRRIAFISASDHLVPKDTPRPPVHAAPIESNDLFVRDLDQGKTTLVSANAAGTDSANAPTHSVGSFSPEGDRIAFSTGASNLGPPDHNGPAGSDVYLATLDGVDLTATAEATPDPVPTGEKLTYELVVANFGPDTADGAEGAVFLPQGVTFISATTSAGSCAPPPPTGDPIVSCALGNLGDGDSVTITVKATVDAPASTVLTAIAGASSPTPELDGSDNYRSVETNVG